MRDFMSGVFVVVGLYLMYEAGIIVLNMVQQIWEVNFMTKQKLLKGLNFRLKTLKEAYECLSTKSDIIAPRIIDDYENRIDEVEQIYIWIKESYEDESSVTKRKKVNK